MATDQRNITFDSTTNPAFRAWGAALAAALVAGGLVKHTDTGQIDWVNVVPSGSSIENIQGYEIYRFNDALQATKPVFIKIEYGYFSNPAGARGGPVIYITVGTSTNGAGTITGSVISARTRFMGTAVVSSANNGATNTSPAASPVWTAGDGSWIGMAVGASATARPTTTLGSANHKFSFPAFLVIDRTRDLTGAGTGDGLVLMTSHWPPTGTYGDVDATGPINAFQMLSFTGSGVATQDGYWPFLWPGNGFQTGSQGGDLYAWPMPLATPKGQPQCLAVLGIYKSDVALGTVVSMTVLQGIHNYISLASIAGTANNDASRGYVNTGITSGAVLMRWE
jgi:hypothetical protein